MEAKELRIGNILLCAKRDIPYRVTAEDILVIDDGSSKSRPVPLTEEILLKCGAKKTDKDDSFGGFIVYYPNGNGMRIKNNEWISQHITVKLEYLHQLQNLYFALTNEELTVNL